MKKRALILTLALSCILTFTCLLAACGSETGSVISVAIQNGGADVTSLTADTSEGYVVFGVKFDKTGNVSEAVKFTSSNEAVATVTASGAATLVGVGETTVTVTSVADASKSDSVKLTVTADEANKSQGKVESVKITLPAAENMQDEYLSRTLETETINFTVEIIRSGGASSAVTFTSSNPAVATVTKGGAATLLSPGQTTITVTADANIALSHSITLNVKPNPADVTDYKVKINGGYAQHNNETVTTAREKDFVYIYAEPPVGQELKKWICNSGNAKIEDGLWGKLTMPAGDVEFTAVFGPIADGIKLSLEGISSAAPFTVTPVADTDYTALKVEYTGANAYAGLYGYYTPPYNTAAIGGMGNDPVVDTKCSVTIQNLGQAEITVGVDLKRDDTYITVSKQQAQIIVPAGETVTADIDCSGKLTIFQLVLIAPGGDGGFIIRDVTFRQR